MYTTSLLVIVGVAFGAAFGAEAAAETVVISDVYENLFTDRDGTRWFPLFCPRYPRAAKCTSSG